MQPIFWTGKAREGTGGGERRDGDRWSGKPIKIYYSFIQRQSGLA